MIQAVIFDMDGVLFDTERLMKEGWMQAAEKMHFTLTEEQMNQLRGGSRIRNAALFQEWYHGAVDYYEGRALRSRYVDEYVARCSIPQKKGLKELLSYLREHNILCAVATSTDRERAAHYWELAGITEFFAASVCGTEAKKSKPDPAIFLAAAEKLNIPIENCLIVEDSINGLKAARASGGISCMIPDLTPYTDDLKSVCDYVCEDLTGCIPILDSENV